VSRTHGTKESWLAALRADGASMLAAVSEPGMLDASVPSCPEWTVGDLIRHLGGVYRRTRTHAGSGRVDAHWAPLVIPDDAPAASDPQLVGWLSAELSSLDKFLDGLDPELPAWNWAPQARTAGFWHRRMAQETALHRWDAQLATGLAEPIESRLAVDGVAEALDTFLPAGRRRATGDAAGLVRLVAEDHAVEWYVRLRGGGVTLLDTDTVFDDDTYPARATATGSASDLLLALWGRIAFDVTQIEGDAALLDALQVR
jgi:uncharacterized protein (TIGR03083 family)